MTFEEWFGAQLPRLLRFTTVLCGGPDPAEEVLQDVAIKAMRRWDTLQDLEHPEAYLRRMIVNEHLSWRRKWSRLIPAAELTKLPRRQKAVLVLRYFEGLPDAEIADLLGCSASTVRSHLARALAALRIELADPRSGRRSEEGSRAH